MSADYFIGVFPITERQLQLVSGTAPTDAESLTKPASLKHYTVRNRNYGVWPANGHTVSSTGFLGLLRTRSGGYQFDLPTEAQWEFACRAATGSAFCDGNEIGAANNGNTLANVTDYGWVGGNTDAGETVMPVGLKKPNGFGLYDMHGNLWEWCLDFYDDLYGLSESEFAAAQTTPVVDPVGATDKAWNDLIVLKGGSISYTTPDKLHKARSGYHFAKGYCDDIYWEGGCTVRVVCPIAPVE